MRIKGSGINRIKLFTHSDLDGIGSAILARFIFKDSADINIEMTSTADKAIKNFLSDIYSLSNYSKLYITDLSISEELADLIESVCTENGLSFRLFDHHYTSINLNERQWCTVKEDDSSCGTSLFYNYLLNNILDKSIVKNLKNYKELVSAITMFDTGTWSENNAWISNQLNILLRILGKSRFLERFVEDYRTKLSIDEMALIQLEQERADRYIYSHKLTSFLIELSVPNLGKFPAIVCYANDYYLEMFTELFNSYPEINLAILINFPYGISYRLRKGVDNIDLSKLSQFFGGGGHIQSAGSRLSNDFIKSMTKSIFEFHGNGSSVIIR